MSRSPLYNGKINRMPDAEPAATSDQHRSLRVFLCHARADKSTVRTLSRRLQADGIEPWLDEEKLLPGQIWSEEIEIAVRKSDAVVVCLSKQSVTKEGYVQKEIALALDLASEKPEGTIFLIPVRLQQCSVPNRLRPWHWVDLFEEDGYTKLLGALRTRASSIGIRESVLPKLKPTRKRLLSRSLFVVCLSILLCLGVALYVIYNDSESRDRYLSIIHQWLGEAQVCNPLPFNQPYRDDDDIIYEATKNTSVKAAFNGIVTNLDGQRLDLRSSQPSQELVLRYIGLASVIVKDGAVVRCGDVIGSINIGNPHPFRAPLRVTLSRNGRVIPPPQNVSLLYAKEGQKLYASLCSECHEARKVVVLHDGKFRSGERATREAVSEKIARGSSMGMPSFHGALSDADLQALTTYLLLPSNVR
jgi:hypothetical protein